jgi:WD40 repeat protein
MIPLVSSKVLKVASERLNNHFGGSMAFSPDGKLLAYTIQGKFPEGGVELREAATGNLIEVFRGFPVPQSVAFSPDGKTLASGNADGTVRLWDTASFAAPQVLHGLHAVKTRSPNGRFLAGGAREWDQEKSTKGQLPFVYRTIKLWDRASGKELRAFPAAVDFGADFGWIAFSPDNSLLAWCWGEKDPRTEQFRGGIKLWDPHTGKAHSTIDLKYWAGSLAFSPDGKLLAWGGGDQDPVTKKAWGTVGRWERSSGRLLPASKVDFVVNHVAFSPDGTLAVASKLAPVVKLLRGTTGEEIGTLRSGFNGINTVSFSSDGKQLAANGTRGGIVVWDVTTGGISCTIRDFVASYGIVFRPDDDAPHGKRLATTYQDGTVRTGGDSRGLPRPVFQAEQRAETPAGSQVESPPKDLGHRHP